MTVERMRRSAQHTRVSLREPMFSRQAYFQFVHLLEVPAERAVCAVHFKSHLTFRAGNNPACFQCATCAVFKSHQRADIVLVCNRAHRAIRISVRKMCAGTCSRIFKIFKILRIKSKTFMNGSLLSCKSCKSYNPASISPAMKRAMSMTCESRSPSVPSPAISS